MILAILQARCSSRRLPQKVLRPILGIPMLLHEIRRIQKSKKIDHLVVATSVSSDDDGLEKICKEQGVDVYRGDLEDVLDRYYHLSLIHISYSGKCEKICCWAKNFALCGNCLLYTSRCV